LEKRRFDETLDILLVVNPTEDLDGAEREGEIVRKLVQEVSSVKVSEVRGRAATHERLLREFRSGNYDVIHYAGHASFDPASPGRSGILCADRKVLSGEDLTTVADLPVLVFFNACESGRVRKAPKPIDRLQESVSFAEAFLRGGIANFIGTYWPVGDESAEAFAKTFYGQIVAGHPVGDALIAGRRVVKDIGSYDWADYIHYGDPDFCIKETGSRGF
jgi:CHAT domain-containing protein